MSEIIKALNAAYKECGYVQKQKTQGLNYSYAGESALIEALRPVLLSHGVIVYQSGIADVKHDQYTTAKGTVQNRVVATFHFTFAHTSGESISVTAMGEGVDAGDKAAYKANTGALKYALRQTLLIETGDDPDREIPEPRPSKEDEEKEDRNREKADKTIIRALEVLKPLDGIERANKLMESGDMVSALKWVKSNYPDKFKTVAALGVDV